MKILNNSNKVTFQLIIDIPNDQEDAVSELLWEQGALNIQVRKNGKQKNIKSQFNSKKDITLPCPHRWEALKSVSWKQNEEVKFRGFTLNCPNTVFGNSKHPSTKIALKILDTYLVDQKGNHFTIADIGTGSGILAFAAWKHGASQIYAIDNSPKAIQTAQKNAQLNKIPDTIFQLNSISTWTPGTTFNMVVANVPIDVLENNFEKLISLTSPNGILLVTGLTTKWENTLLSYFKTHNLEILQRLKENDWLGFALKKTPETH